MPDWFLTNKYPLINNSGDAIGVMGAVRPYADKDNLSKIGDLKWERDDEIEEQLIILETTFVQMFLYLI